MKTIKFKGCKHLDFENKDHLRGVFIDDLNPKLVPYKGIVAWSRANKDIEQFPSKIVFRCEDISGNPTTHFQICKLESEYIGDVGTLSEAECCIEGFRRNCCHAVDVEYDTEYTFKIKDGIAILKKDF